MTSPRILVFAYSDLGHACLKFLLDHKENVVGLYTHQDSPTEKIWFPSSAELARKFKVPVRTPEGLNSSEEQAVLKKYAPDLIFSFYYRNMIPNYVLSLPKLGAYNMHGSHLPKFRGRAPVNWAVLHGETETGATLHVMVDKPDAGDIIDQEAVKIGPDDTTAIVQARVTEAAVKVLARQIENLKSGKAKRIPQDHSKSSYYGRRKPEDGRFDWSWPAKKIHDLVRAVSKPYPGATTRMEGANTIIWKTRLTGKKVSSTPIGQPRHENGGLFITCGDHNEIEILEFEKK